MERGPGEQMMQLLASLEGPGVGSLEDVTTVSSLGDAFQGREVAARVQDFGGWRRCRPDGNCFYRAFGFALIESIVRRKPPRLRHILQEITKSCDPNEMEALVQLLSSLAGMEAQAATEEWYRRYLADPVLDELLVKTMRQAAAHFLDQHREDEFDGLPIAIWCEAVSGMELNSFIKNSLTVNGHEADNFHVTIVAMAFGKIIEVVQPDKKWETYTVPPAMPDQSSHPSCTLMMWQPEGVATTEFDILYRRENKSGELPLKHLFQLEQQLGLSGSGGGQASSFGEQASSSSSRRKDPKTYSSNRSARGIQNMPPGPDEGFLSNVATDGSIGAAKSSLSQAVKSAEKAIRDQQSQINSEFERMAKEKEDLQRKRRQIQELQMLLEEKQDRLAKETEEVSILHAKLEQEKVRAKSGGFFGSCCSCPDQKKGEMKVDEEDGLDG